MEHRVRKTVHRRASPTEVPAREMPEHLTPTHSGHTYCTETAPEDQWS
jgi:hypothetical protein